MSRVDVLFPCAHRKHGGWLLRSLESNLSILVIIFYHLTKSYVQPDQLTCVAHRGWVIFLL